MKDYIAILNFIYVLINFTNFFIFIFPRTAGLRPAGKTSTSKPERLGVAGLALHYANIITQIDNIVSLLQNLVLS